MKTCKSNKGIIHGLSAVNSEFSICGDAWDGETGSDKDPNAWKLSKVSTITCEKCLDEIKNCKSYKS